MSNQKPVELSPEARKAIEQQNVKTKVDELTNLSRLVVNTLNLVCSNDVKIPSAYAKPVSEIQSWLEGMHQNIQNNLNVLRPMLSPEDQKAVPQQVTPQVEAKQPMVDAETPKAVKLEVAPETVEAPKA